MFRTIRSRLIFSHFLVILIAMGASGFLLLSFLEHYFLQVTEDNLAAQASITIQTLIPNASLPADQTQNLADVNASQVMNALPQQNIYVQSENTQPVSADLSHLANASLQIGTQLNTRIRILNPQNALLLDSRNQGEALTLDEQIFINGDFDGDYAVRVNADNTMDLVMPIWVDSGQAGVVLLSQSLNDVSTVLGALRGGWIFSTTTVGLLASVIGLLLSQVITNPLRQLTVAVGAVAAGNYSQQVITRSDDELGRLGRTFNDMTRRLGAAKQMQTNFVANVSHELRTPLTSIKGMVETLRDGAVDDLDVRDSFLATLESETNRMIRLVNDLLTLSRADSEALGLRHQSFDLSALVESSIEQMRSHGREIVLKSQKRPLMVTADADRVRQVLVNLLDNALKYSKDCVEVYLGADKLKGVQVRISDRGIGIPSSDLPSIGQRFYRTDRARSRSQGGSGLGIAIAQALVEAHGGSLWIESKEGEGTSACFTIP